MTFGAHVDSRRSSPTLKKARRSVRLGDAQLVSQRSICVAVAVSLASSSLPCPAGRISVERPGVARSVTAREIANMKAPNAAVSEPEMAEFRYEFGGGGGILTHERLAPLTVFKTVPINHSGTPPKYDFSLFSARAASQLLTPDVRGVFPRF